MKKLLLSVSLVFLFSCVNENVDINFQEPVTPLPVNTIVPLAPCVNGLANNYPCSGYDLIAHIPLRQLGTASVKGNDCWGWTDPSNQNEYALMGTTEGIVFINITDPVNPVIVGGLKTATISSIWRDVKVYNNFAFIVADRAGAHGMQVFDLTRLRNVTTPQDFTADFTYSDFGSAHNIVINESQGYAYPVGTTRAGTFAGGPLFINIQNPLNPVSEGGFAGYAHDAQVVTYNGPDTDHTGKEILIGSNENEVVIVDVSDKANPVQISTIAYSNIGYTHQGWFTENQKYFILGDELDERDFGGKTRTLIFDFTDLDNPVFHTEYLGPTEAIDHNGYVKDNTYFLANYTAGVRMLDITDIENKNLSEVGFFDTYPQNDNTAFNGAWNVYPYFSSGNIIISDIDSGFFIIRKSGT